jgi:hypothetical protein
MRRLTCAAIVAVVFLCDPALAQKAIKCAADLRAAGQVAVTGIVRDSASNVALFGSRVFATPIPPGIERGDRFEVRAGTGGQFRICLNRTTYPINVYADFFGRKSNILQVKFTEDADSIMMHLAVIMLERAKVGGRVLDVSGRPVINASLKLEWGGYSQVTDQQGNFLFPDVPPGRYQLEVSHIGYLTVADSLSVSPGEIMELAIRVSPSAIPLEPLTVTVKSRRLESVGFYSRQKGGHGAFLSRSEIEKGHPSLTSDILRNISGVRLNPRGVGRGYTVLGRGNCRYRYYVDGVRVSSSFEIDDFEWQWIDALEVYRGASESPPQFGGSSMDDPGSCGAIVIWTRTTG